MIFSLLIYPIIFYKYIVLDLRVLFDFSPATVMFVE